MCIAVFYLGNIRWYIMEGQQEGNDFMCFFAIGLFSDAESTFPRKNGKKCCLILRQKLFVLKFLLGG